MDGVAVGAVVGRVDAVGIVEERRGMLNRHREHAREVVARPRPLEVVPGLAHPPRVAHHPREEPRPARGRLGREAEGGLEPEVVGLEDHGVPPPGVVVVAAGQQDDGAQVHGVPPPLAENTAPDLHALDPLGVRRNLDRGKDVGELQADRRLRSGVYTHAPRGADEVARRERPALALPLVLRGPDDVAVLPAELRVDVEQRLDPVVARRQLAQARVRIAVGAGVDEHRPAWFDPRHVGGEEGHAAVALPRRVVGGDAGLGLRGRGQGQEEAAGQRAVVKIDAVGDLDAEPRRLPGAGGLATRCAGAGGQGDEQGRGGAPGRSGRRTHGLVSPGNRRRRLIGASKVLPRRVLPIGRLAARAKRGVHHARLRARRTNGRRSVALDLRTAPGGATFPSRRHTL